MLPNNNKTKLPNDMQNNKELITPVHADFRIRMRINADVTSARVADPQ